MAIDVVAFAIPGRVVLESNDGGRWTGHVTHFEGDCIWVYLRDVAAPPLRSSVRLVFRRPGEASLGMGASVMWLNQERVAVEVDHPVDRMIVRQWARGETADASELVRVDGTETPTAEFPPVVEALIDRLDGASLPHPRRTPDTAPTRAPAVDVSQPPTLDEGPWPDPALDGSSSAPFA